jgi:hypothetical protein
VYHIVGHSLIAVGAIELVIHIRCFCLVGGVEVNALPIIVESIHRIGVGLLGAIYVCNDALIAIGAV